ncbi:hypothetical protein AXF42_Ash016588 [Apostasia shenzhenica]|uniref:Uncharacterized protein n=1 Tax=Apostasia shenzhenica TaxID=1088818 RepID=A0A2I0A1I2_9ASPA|nr:hypothetical protein AXF42_Ash016588 [Apostasia shenzhenica]
MTLASISKKRAGKSPADVPPPEKKRPLALSEGSPKSATSVHVGASLGEEAGATVVAPEAGAPALRVAAVPTQTLGSIQESASVEAAVVVDLSDSPVRPPPRIGELKGMALVHETAAGEKLASGKILLNDEEVERLLPKLGAPAGGAKKLPLLVCGPASLGTSISSSGKKRRPLFPSFSPVSPRNDEKKKEKGRKEEGRKMEEVTKGEKEVPSQAAPESALGIEGPGGKMEEAIKETERVPPATSSVVYGVEGSWSVLGERLFKIRRKRRRFWGIPPRFWR